MRTYDFALANKIIKTFYDLGILERAMMGVHEDWFYYSEEVFVDGNYVHDGLANYEEGDDIKIAGINHSMWATPVILIETINGMQKYFNCYTGDWDIDILERITIMVHSNPGPVAGRVQELREEIEIFNFVENEYNL